MMKRRLIRTIVFVLGLLAAPSVLAQGFACDLTTSKDGESTRQSLKLLDGASYVAAETGIPHSFLLIGFTQAESIDEVGGSPFAAYGQSLTIRAGVFDETNETIVIDRNASHADIFFELGGGFVSLSCQQDRPPQPLVDLFCHASKLDNGEEKSPLGALQTAASGPSGTLFGEDFYLLLTRSQGRSQFMELSNIGYTQASGINTDARYFGQLTSIPEDSQRGFAAATVSGHCSREVDPTIPQVRKYRISSDGAIPAFSTRIISVDVDFVDPISNLVLSYYTTGPSSEFIDVIALSPQNQQIDLAAFNATNEGSGSGVFYLNDAIWEKLAFGTWRLVVVNRGSKEARLSGNLQVTP